MDNNAPQNLPYQMLLKLAGNDKNLSGVLTELQNYNGDAKSLFFEKAKQMGVNPNDILNQLR